VNRAGDRSPHERSDMRVVKTDSDFKTGSTPDIASLIRATVDPGYLLTRKPGYWRTAEASEPRLGSGVCEGGV
jgi:hypothetical protein